MFTARVITKGRKQIVLFPKEIHIKAKEVEIFRRGGELVFREMGKAVKGQAHLPAKHKRKLHRPM